MTPDDLRKWSNERAKQMAEEAVRDDPVFAERLRHEIDEALHPWGDPGAVPTDVGYYEMQERATPDARWGPTKPVNTARALFFEDAQSPVEVHGIGWTWSAHVVDRMQGYKGHRFRERTRWTPKVPR